MLKKKKKPGGGKKQKQVPKSNHEKWNEEDEYDDDGELIEKKPVSAIAPPTIDVEEEDLQILPLPRCEPPITP